MNSISNDSILPNDNSNLNVDAVSQIKAEDEVHEPKQSVSAGKETIEVATSPAITPTIPKYHKIPNIQGICFFLDPKNSDLEEGALTLEIRQALKQKVPLVCSPHLIKQAWKELDPQAIDNFDVYKTMAGGYLILIPKYGDDSISLKSLRFNPNLQKVENSDIKSVDSPLLNKKEKPSYQELLEVFQRQGNETISKPRLGIYIIGHGSLQTQSTANLPKHQYLDFLRFIDKQYSISCCAVASCQPHTIEEEIEGIFVRKGTPNIDSYSKREAEFGQFFRKVNEIKPSLIGISGQKDLSEALSHIGKIESFHSQFMIKLPSNRNAKMYKTSNKYVISMQDIAVKQLSKHISQKKEKLKPSVQEKLIFTDEKPTQNISSRLKPMKLGKSTLSPSVRPTAAEESSKFNVSEEITEIHLLTPHIPYTVEIAGKTPMLLSHQKLQGIQIFQKVLAKNEKHLDVLLNNFFTKGTLPSGKHLFLFNEIELEDVVYRDLYVTLIEGSLSCSFQNERSISGNAIKPHPETIKKVDREVFLKQLHSAMYMCKPFDRYFREVTEAKMTVDDLFEIIQKQFFGLPWISDTSGAQSLSSLLEMIKEAKTPDRFILDMMVDHLVKANLIAEDILFSDLQVDDSKPSFKNEGFLTLKTPIGPLTITPDMMRNLRKGIPIVGSHNLSKDLRLSYSFKLLKGEFVLILEKPFPKLLKFLDPKIIPKFTHKSYWDAIKANDLYKLRLILADFNANVDLYDSEVLGLKPLDHLIRTTPQNIEMIRLFVEKGAIGFNSAAFGGEYLSLEGLINKGEGAITPELNEALILLASIDKGQRIDKAAWIAAAKSGVSLEALTPFIRGLRQTFPKETLSKERMLAAIERPSKDLLSFIVNKGIAVEKDPSYLEMCVEVGSIDKFKILLQNGLSILKLPIIYVSP